MFDDRDLMRAAGLVVGRGIALKVGMAGALVGVLTVLMLAPFSVTNDQANAACLPSVPGRADDPEVIRPLRTVQIAYAKLIDQIAVARGLPGRATLVALMTALQESQLQNLNYGDRDSIGLFQQRPSAGWGTRAQIMDPRYSVEAFFGGAKPPSPPGLVDIDRWMSLPLTDAAQAVQVSAFPDAYARHEQTARDIAAQASIDLERSGDPYAGRAGPRPNEPPSQILDECGGSELVAGTPVNGVWPEQSASVVDPTGTGGMVTPRTAAWVALVRSALRVSSITCWDAHAWNPSSDHPKGKACDLMIGTDARRSAAQRATGNRIANWTVRTAAKAGVHYVIWYGQIWTARTGRWAQYDGGGIYDPSDATGGHFNHVHVSLY